MKKAMVGSDALKENELAGTTFEKVANVHTDQEERMVGDRIVVDVYCNKCYTLLGVKIIENGNNRGALRVGDFLLHLTKLQKWNGNEIVDADAVVDANDNDDDVVDAAAAAVAAVVDAAATAAAAAADAAAAASAAADAAAAAAASAAAVAAAAAASADAVAAADAASTAADVADAYANAAAAGYANAED
ncbi:antifreeze protein Maxi-like isoform X2 [Camellia sinensis]|uniref:antifreeze protein Maxi-like isoform X2 n=1 Tax=Camellia sinensis TaxID=4442 RepID=UPI00103629EE|nr:antifreeze protein Maxi-like isoform X2 [Camellia sinensis]XP_028056317.1 antifreeze protein Maxi-like isoform X2 [Camellia sinensis]XP_028056318.1 antifreeze protein Maxi-like isoform X2 [Camellia sinensis]XP_028056319.1 antifreeze protein Maxi-like isoform X2 [Camellia sinensis]XP_028056320.1 antifreeze protein Maxi-like isoform X2 [Camellia sinensis]